MRYSFVEGRRHDANVFQSKDPRNIQWSDPRFTDPEKTWVSNSSSLATYFSRGPLGFGPIEFLVEKTPGPENRLTISIWRISTKLLSEYQPMNVRHFTSEQYTHLLKFSYRKVKPFFGPLILGFIQDRWVLVEWQGCLSYKDLTGHYSRGLWIEHVYQCATYQLSQRTMKLKFKHMFPTKS